MTCGFGIQVDTFTLSCSYSEPSQMIIRPNANGAWIHHYPIPDENDNWENVCEEICDNNLTYNYWDYPSEVSDFYDCEDLSIPTDYDINSIVVTAKNLCDIEYSDDFIYKIIISDNDGVDVFETYNMLISCNPSGISGVFKTVAYSWAENPRTGLPWTNDELNNLQIGINSKSKIQSYSNNTYCWLGTSENGSIIQLTPIGYANNWQCVQFQGSSSNYVRNNTSDTWQEDLYIFENDNVIVGYPYPNYFDLSYNIRRVRLYFKIYKENTQTCKAKLLCKTHGSKYYGSEKIVAQGYDAIAVDWFTNPNTGVAWTWQEVLDGEFGIALWSDVITNYVHAYDGELLVIYDRANTSKIATSQMYATINLTAYNTMIAKLPKPSAIPLSHDIETKSLNFQSGNRKTYGLKRNGKKLTLTGLIWDGCVDGILTGAEIINNIRTMAKYLEPVTITGLKYTQYNTTYNIITFNPVQVQQKPNLYEWELVLEFCN
jgi:hypothetical protein